MITEIEILASFTEYSYGYEPKNVATFYSNNSIYFELKYGLFRDTIRRLLVQVDIKALLEFALIVRDFDPNFDFKSQAFKWGQDDEYEILVSHSNREAIDGVEFQVVPYLDEAMFLSIYDIKEVLAAIKGKED